MSSRFACRSGAGAVVLLIWAALTGCGGGGYSFGSAYPGDISTVAVEVFRNDTFEPALGAELAEAVTKEVQRVTPWAVTSAERAQTRLTGEIRRVELRPFAQRRGTGLTQEIAYRITVDFRFEDARSGAPRVVRRNFTGQETFAPARGVGERIGVGRSHAVNRLAQEIVAELRSDF